VAARIEGDIACVPGAPSGGAMNATVLLSRLDGVRRTGSERWLARCPAHEDRKASLSIRELGDGRLLVHDFAGCDVENILGAVELGFDALFPARSVEDRRSPERRAFPAADVLQAVGFEALIVAVAAENLARGQTLTDTDQARLMIAVERITAAVRESDYA
jgi:hypothetical protein